jgi:hypothetical protein
MLRPLGRPPQVDVRLRFYPGTCGRRMLPTAQLRQRHRRVSELTVACVAGIEQGVHILRHTFCSHLAMKGAPARAIQELGRTRGSLDDAALHPPESGNERRSGCSMDDSPASNSRRILETFWTRETRWSGEMRSTFRLRGCAATADWSRAASERAKASEPRERSGATGPPRASVSGIWGRSPQIKKD